MTDKVSVPVHKRKIKLLVKTDITVQFLFAASPILTIKELLGELKTAIREFSKDQDGPFFNPSLNVKGTANLRKGDYYLLPSDTVGDTLIDNDEVKCDVIQGSDKSSAKENKSQRKAIEKFEYACKKTEKPLQRKKSVESESIEVELEVSKEDKALVPKKPVAKKTVSDVKLYDSDSVAFPKPRLDFGDLNSLTPSLVKKTPTEGKSKDKPTPHAVITAVDDDYYRPTVKKYKKKTTTSTPKENNR